MFTPEDPFGKNSSGTGWSDGSALNRQKVISWTNDDYREISNIRRT